MNKLCNTNLIKKITRWFILSNIIVLSISSSMAAQTTGTMNVTTTIADACILSNIGTMTFTGYNGSTTADAQANFSVTCSNGVNYNIGIDAGSNAGGANNTSARKLKKTDSSATLTYDLYKDPARLTRWGIAGGELGGTVGGTGSTETYTVYGRITQTGASPTPGTYNDSVSIIVNF